MTDAPTLFPTPEPYRADPRTTRVREHSRVVTPRARRTDPLPSVQAAASITPGRIESRILPVLEHGPQTASEITARIEGAYLPTVVSALSRLRDAGCVVDTGETRLSARKRPSTVWALVEDES